MHHTWGDLDINVIEFVDRSSEEQGFIDQFGNFLTRKEAYIIARNNGQIYRELDNDTNELYSEHLY
jgi:hypothetical protein